MWRPNIISPLVLSDDTAHKRKVIDTYIPSEATKFIYSNYNEPDNVFSANNTRLSDSMNTSVMKGVRSNQKGNNGKEGWRSFKTNSMMKERVQEINC